MIIIVSVNCKLIKASYLTRAATFGDRFPLVSGGRYFGVFVNDDVVKMPGPDTRTEKHFRINAALIPKQPGIDSGSTLN